MSSTNVRLRRMPGKMNRYLSHRPDTASRRVGCRSALDVPSMPDSRVDNFATCNDNCGLSRTNSTVLSESDTVTTLENEPNGAARLLQNTLPSHSACSANRGTSSGENDYPSCNCSVMNHRNHSFTWIDVITWRMDCQWRSSWRIKYLLICLLIVKVCIARECAIGLDTPGWTEPRGDIYIQYGKPLQIYCTLNQTDVAKKFPGKTVSDITFFRGSESIEEDYIQIINETTVLMTLEKPKPSQVMFTCALKIKENSVKRLSDYQPICINIVGIGFPPAKPKNFDCISNNWENLTCTWEPAKNYIPTAHSLMFTLSSRSAGVFPCPNIPDLPDNTCIWSSSTSPIYRQPYQFYFFIMKVHNILGIEYYRYKFNHFSHVLPVKPTDLGVVNKTAYSVLLHWEVDFPMEVFPPGMHHRIMYQNQWDHDKDWQVINDTSNKHQTKRCYNLTLQYANTMYDIRVSVKSAVAIEERMWSPFSGTTFRTLSVVPARPPRTDIGSFEITENHSNRDVYLYWQPIPQYLENGDNFKYEILNIQENGQTIDLVPTETTKTYAKFKGISFNDYRFEIIATNQVGRNKDKAVIHLPSKLQIPQEPVSFTKIAFDEGLYELSWKPQIMDKDITDYTIFWCENERDRPYQCTGYLDWVHVPSSAVLYNMTVPDPNKVYQFAISVNTERGSSGMVWASCTVIHNKMVGKMKSVWISRIGSYVIDVGWKLDCSDRIGTIEGFIIYYCPILSPFNLNCKGPKLNKTIEADPDVTQGIVDNLKPYTTYRLAVAVLTKNGEGLHSDPLYNTTLEAAPSTSPINVKITNVTNTTMFITWKPPEAMNGVLRYYEVYYNGRSRKVDEGNHIELRDLLAYKKYNISVSACTVACSEKSLPIYGITKIGTPSKINVPVVSFMNSSLVHVKWDEPQYPAGPLTKTYYEILGNNGEVQNSTGLGIELSIPDCTKSKVEKRNYNFQVRAVNVVSDNVHLKGPWSDPGQGSCYHGEPEGFTWTVVWLLGGVSVILLLVCLWFSIRRMWLKCQAMQDVEVKLPPGLTPNMKLLQKGEPHIRQPSADSSGCSSGQESVTSSLTAESRVSSDSGTEVDPVPVSPDKLLESLPTWEATQLRQRSISRMESALTTDDTSNCWVSYITVTKSGEPILSETLSLARSTPNLTNSTGYTTSQHTWSSTGYISMPSSEELSSNPSPVPRENTITNIGGSGTGGGYSIIGSVAMQTKSEGDDDVNMMENTVGNALIPIKSETKSASNPYVTLASLEQKQREKQKPAVDTYRDLDELSALVEPNKKLKLDTLASHFTTSDTTTSKPYVQAGLMDTVLHKSFASNSIEQLASGTSVCGNFASFTDSCNKSLVSSPMSLPVSSSLTMTMPTSTKPLIAVSAMTEITRSPTHTMEKSKDSAMQETLHVSHMPASSEGSSKPYLPTFFVPQILQQQRQQEEKIEPPVSIIKDTEANDKDYKTYPSLCWRTTDATIDGKEQSAKLKPNRTPIITKHSSGYVTIAENPNSAISATSHERFEKPPPPQTTNQSDEQYSKVTVVPSTIQ